MTSNIALGYESIALNKPKLSIVKSRSECDTSIQFGPRRFAIPVLPSNMRCTISPFLAMKLMLTEHFHILHRFDTPNLSALKKYTNAAYCETDYHHSKFYSSISIGIQEQDECLIEELILKRIRVEYITIDVAHGHSQRVIAMTKWVKHRYPQAFLIVGNVATPEAVIDLQNAGADAIKVGIGPGKVCTTFRQTGFMSPMFTTVQRCAAVATVPIIADGGIRTNGDIVKALVAGADMVMVGSLFAQLVESPAKTILPKWNTGTLLNNLISMLHPSRYYQPKIVQKEFYGSASEHNKGSKNHIEGTKIILDGIHMSYLEKMCEIKQSLQSAISYAGGKDLSAFNTIDYDVIV